MERLTGKNGYMLPTCASPRKQGKSKRITHTHTHTPADTHTHTHTNGRRDVPPLLSPYTHIAFPLVVSEPTCLREGV